MTEPITTVAHLLGRCLRVAGATRVFGVADAGLEAIPGLGHITVDEPSLAALLADTAGRIARPQAIPAPASADGPPEPDSWVTGPGVAALPGRRLRLSSAPGAAALPQHVTSPGELPAAVAGWSFGSVHAATELVLDLDLDAPAPAGVDPYLLRPWAQSRALTLDPSLGELRMLVLAGPGVARSGQADALRRFAAQAGCGVVNTWGAKGLFRWDDPHHHGTAGLQARDFDLAGFPEAQLIVAVGLDPLESPSERWSHGQVLEVEPWQVETLALRWPEPGAVPPPPALYRDLSEALAPLYASDAVPLSPARAAADLAAARPDGAVVAADPGPAGLWVARAFPTTELGSVAVPAAVPGSAARGFAAAAGVVSSLDGRRCLSVTHDPVDPVTDAVLDQARRWGAAVVLEVWGADPPEGTDPYSPERRSQDLRTALDDITVAVLPVPVDFEQTRVLVDVAGEVVAWR